MCERERGSERERCMYERESDGALLVSQTERESERQREREMCVCVSESGVAARERDVCLCERHMVHSYSISD